jgi:hypothetical protein
MDEHIRNKDNLSRANREWDLEESLGMHASVAAIP